MENNLLQPFLQAGLIDIGDSDERLANIEQSIKDLEKKFKEDYSLLPVYTLVALDPEIPADEQVLIDTETTIASHWKALRAKFSERPIPIIRAVILNALYNTGIGDAYAARIIYLTASNFYPYAKLGREKEIVEKIISELGDSAEKHASEEWSLIEEEPTLKLSSLKVNGIKFEKIQVDVEGLKSNLLEAVKNSPSGHGSNSGGNSTWGPHFAAKSSEGIAAAINTGVNGLTDAISTASIETSINKFFAEFKKSLDETLKNSFNSIRAVERRSKLLWWKETLYSPSVKNSYRSLSKSIQPIVMASDLYDQLPGITPTSVDFLLRDTLLLLNNSANDRIRFDDFISEISKEENKSVLREYLKIGKEGGRISSTDFFALVVNDKVKPSELKQYTGIAGDESVSLADISVIALHDLLIEYLISE